MIYYTGWSKGKNLPIYQNKGYFIAFFHINPDDLFSNPLPLFPYHFPILLLGFYSPCSAILSQFRPHLRFQYVIRRFSNYSVKIHHLVRMCYPVGRASQPLDKLSGIIMMNCNYSDPDAGSNL